MPSKYFPDRWVVVKFPGENNSIFYKVLCAWYGGYTQGDEWKLSSIIVEVKELPKWFEVKTFTGSFYTLHKDAFGMAAVMGGIYKQLEEKLGESNVLITKIPEVSTRIE